MYDMVYILHFTIFAAVMTFDVSDRALLDVGYAGDVTVGGSHCHYTY